MVRQEKVKRGYLNWFSFYVALVLLLVVLLDAHKLYGNSAIGVLVQVVSVLAFYGFIAISLRFDNSRSQKYKRQD